MGVGAENQPRLTLAFWQLPNFTWEIISWMKLTFSWNKKRSIQLQTSHPCNNLNERERNQTTLTWSKQVRCIRWYMGDKMALRVDKVLIIFTVGGSLYNVHGSINYRTVSISGTNREIIKILFCHFDPSYGFLLRTKKFWWAFLPVFLVVTIFVFLARPGKLCFSSLPKSDLCNGPKILKVESVKQNVLKESKRERN